MNEKINEFVETQSKKTNVASSIFKRICNLGYDDNFLEVYKDRESIERIILELRPTDMRNITTICSIISSYARFTENKNACDIIKNIDRNLLWEKAKPNAKPKYISHETYLNVLNDINSDNNAIYYQTLFSSIYEGIYCDDMSVIANLRTSDIDDDIISLHTNEGYSYRMRLPKYLIENLKKVEEMKTWIRQNKYKSYEIDIYGKYEDTCFRIDNRKNKIDDTYKHVYYNKLRKISKEYLQYSLSPKQLFISGVMYRICVELSNNNILIEDAFEYDNKDRKVMNIIAKELSRCEYDIPVKALREQIKGHLEIFKM